MSDVLAIDGSAIDLAATRTTLDHLTAHVKGGIPELHFTRLLSTPGALPDPWHLKACTLTMSGTLVFSGDVVGYVDRYMDGLGWIREYRAYGLEHRANYIPVTDSVSLTDTSTWNLPGNDQNFVGSRAGRTVGEIVSAILTMETNAGPLQAAGIGAYTSAGPYTLPAATAADLAALAVVPQSSVRVAGDRLLGALEHFIQAWHPNHFLQVQPDGTIRVRDPRTFPTDTLTIGSDPRLQMPSLTRDASDCYSQVEVRGSTLVNAVILQTAPWPGSTAADGGLQEDFAWGAFDNAGAKAAWLPSDWSQPNQFGAPFDQGTCTVSDTTHVVVTSSNTAMTWGVDALAQGGSDLLGTITLQSDSLVGLVHQIWQARIIANTALSAGGTSTLTLDNPLPNTSYNGYQIFALAAGANVVGRRYRVTNPAIASKMQNYFPYPVPYVTSTGNSASLVSTPAATVMWPAFGTSPPYNTGIDGITLDPDAGLVWLDKPAQVVAGGLSQPTIWPANVQVFLPIAVGTLSARAPSSSTFAGTLSAVEGVDRTKQISVPEWRDYSNNANMATFAQEFLDSVKDVVVEGTVPYAGLLGTYLAPGRSVSIAGSGFTTGWESLSLPVASCEVTFNQGASGPSYSTVLHLSNRRGRYSSEQFLRPGVNREQFGGGGGEIFSAGGPTFSGVVNSAAAASGALSGAADAASSSLGQSAGSAYSGLSQAAEQAGSSLSSAAGAASEGGTDAAGMVSQGLSDAAGMVS